MNATHRLTYLSLLTAISLSLFVLEGLLPVPFLAPGAKLGLANIVTVFALYTLRARDVLAVILVRIALASLFGGGPTVFFYSIAGGLLSFAAMYALKKTGRFSLPAVSAAGGFFHHVGQLAAAIAMTGTMSLLTYLAILGPVGLVTGLATGFVAASICRRTSQPFAQK
ncbi:Gx transporter family protein [Selenomonas sp.]|uniref:Gx transporter family protein n=1 Tax=Selenomonas sp. TaxID=2053611 RepID=UPI0025F103B4|nr:Gx transporter family protein [Selenomonas sp.]MCI6085951.1 Gx transporter family protein [Selenomonas sp.]MDY3298026.1 Gx transporter family protein [Selenomonas sp.]MDY4415802.1 Gx transporter family protein [Selenomonas sp.]